MSRAVGEALREWAANRPLSGFKLQLGAVVGAGVSEPADGPKPTDARAVKLESWQEVRGMVREVVRQGASIRLVVDGPGGAVAMTLPASAGCDNLTKGARVAILRTDEATREYVVKRD